MAIYGRSMAVNEEVNLIWQWRTIIQKAAENDGILNNNMLPLCFKEF
jgi:hypothetical protein